jgi:hypothetical protein
MRFLATNLAAVSIAILLAPSNSYAQTVGVPICPPVPTVRHAASAPVAARPSQILQEVKVSCGTAAPLPAHSSSGAVNSEANRSLDYTRIIEAVGKLLASFAWPIAAIVIAYHFKKELAGLLARLKKVKAGAAEAEFERRLDEVVEDAGIQPDEVEPPVSASARSAAVADPRGAILGAWLEVEKAVFDLCDARGLHVQSSRPTKGVLPAMREIQRAQVLDSSYVSLFHDLRSLRNEAAHNLDFSPEPEAVIHYTKLAATLTKALKDASNAV